MVAGPLSRFRVIDLTHARAGPTCVRMLADWGADVIRVERPGMDDDIGGKRSSADFQNLHRNKRAITLDLKSDKDREIFHRLAKTADVVIENFRPDVKYRLGIDYDTLQKINPRIICGSVSGFGQGGPYGHRPGVDQIAQGMGGLMSITGLPGQGPVRVGIPIADLTAGIFCAYGVLVALLEREQSGKGQWVQTSLLQAQIFMLDFQAVRWLIDGVVAAPAGNNHPTGIPTGVFATADRPINIGASTDGQFKRLCAVIKAPHLAEDPRYADRAGRSENRHELNAEIERWTAKRPSAELVELLNEAGIPAGPIYTIDEVFADPQAQHLPVVGTVDSPKYGRLSLLAQPMILSRSEARLRSATPELGEHNSEIFRELGVEEDAMQDG